MMNCYCHKAAACWNRLLHRNRMLPQDFRVAEQHEILLSQGLEVIKAGATCMTSMHVDLRVEHTTLHKLHTQRMDEHRE